MKLYHGSKKIVSMPICDHKNDNSDFGRGFYATESEELAREWASDDEKGGIISVYEIDSEDLEITDLCREDCDLSEWLSVILSNRIIPFSSREEAEFCENYIDTHLPDLSGSDIVKGYRADDSTLSFCRDYIKGNITSEQLLDAVRCGNLGEQVLVRTESALKKLNYIASDTVDGSIYYPRRIMRDINARGSLYDIPLLFNESAYPETYLTDAMTCIGELMTYASIAAPELSSDMVLKMFTISGLASRFEKGDPRIVSGMSGAELFYRIMDECGEFRYHRPKPGIIPGNDTDFGCGRLLAFFQWKSRMSFSDILSAMPFARLTALYPDLSDVPLNEAAVTIKKKLLERMPAQTRLQVYRKRLGLSQKELAAYSGVNLRTLQQYETGDKDINRAASDKVAALSRTLHCAPEQIIEPSSIKTFS